MVTFRQRVSLAFSTAFRSASRWRLGIRTTSTAGRPGAIWGELVSQQRIANTPRPLSLGDEAADLVAEAMMGIPCSVSAGSAPSSPLVKMDSSERGAKEATCLLDRLSRMMDGRDDGGDKYVMTLDIA
jgi:hypothetical protein